MGLGLVHLQSKVTQSHLQQARKGHLRQRRMCFCSALNSVCLRHSNFVFSTVCLHFTSFLFVLYVYTYSILYLFAAPPILLLSCEDTGFRGQLSSATGTRFRLQQIAELLVAPENLHLHGRAAGAAIVVRSEFLSSLGSPKYPSPFPINIQRKPIKSR